MGHEQWINWEKSADGFRFFFRVKEIEVLQKFREMFLARNRNNLLQLELDRFVVTETIVEFMLEVVWCVIVAISCVNIKLGF